GGRTERPRLRAILYRASLHAQAFDRNAANEMFFHDLTHVVDLHAAVPDLFGVDDDRGAARALIQATGGVGANPALHAALVQKALELVANRLASLLRAAPLRIAGIAPVHADEDVLFVVRLGHRRILYNPPTRRAHRQGHVLAA